MVPPNPIWIYRITHIDNLDYDLQWGLHSVKSEQVNPNYKRIGDSSLISIRNNIKAIDPPGGILSDYIPFYFGPRSPMLFQIATGWEDIEQFDQQDIIYYISSVPTLQRHKKEYFFTDGHARRQTTNFYNEDVDFDQLDWEAIAATKWKSDETDLRRKDKKQAEIFIKEYLPVTCIQYIGVYNSNAQEFVLALLAKHKLAIPVRISPEKLYYDRL